MTATGKKADNLYIEKGSLALWVHPTISDLHNTHLIEIECVSLQLVRIDWPQSK